MLDFALQYAARGWRVFRLTGYKTPFKGSHGFKDGTTDAKVIERLWGETPHANIGLATGYNESPATHSVASSAKMRPSNLVVFDADGPGGLREFKEAAQAAGASIPRTLTAKTSKGWHFYFIAPPGVRIKKVTAPRAASGEDGLDINADGAYVVVPPSVNARTGFVYAWVNPLDPIAEMPEWLIAWCRAKAAARKRGPLPANSVRPSAAGGLTGSPSVLSSGAPAGRRISDRVLASARRGELTGFLSALQRINGIYDYDRWFEIGAAIHDFASGDDGLAIFKAFGRRDASGQRAEADLLACEKKWVEYGREKVAGQRLITKATIYALANASIGTERKQDPPLAGGHHEAVNGVAALPSIFTAPDSQSVTDPIFVDLDKQGLPKSTCTNTGIAIAALGVDCRKDSFHERMLVAGHSVNAWAGDLSDDVVLMLRKLIKASYGFDPGSSNALDATIQLCLEHTFNPVIEYLDALTWDSVPRIGRWVVDYLGAPASALNCEFGRLMLIAAVRRARKPGVKFDQIVVFEGFEGTGKSSAVKILAGEDNFSDQNILAASDKEQQEAFRGVWIHEIAELAGMKRTEVERVKQFASRTEDRARPAYGRVRVDMKRRGIFVATTNDQEYLKSTTGNRRFWPIETNDIKLEALARDRDQLWAEAAKDEAKGHSIELNAKYRAQATEEQDRRTETDPWVGLIDGKINSKIGRIDSISVLDLLETKLVIPLTQIRQAEMNRGARALKKLGFYRAHERTETGFKWIYKRSGSGHTGHN